MIGARDIRIEIDGGVAPTTAPLVVNAGADVLVAGSAVFKGGPSAYAANISAIRASVANESRSMNATDDCPKLSSSTGRRSIGHPRELDPSEQRPTQRRTPQ
jgi:hypothetical protein